MNWFQRYGIPGAVFWGLLVLWIMAFYHGSVDIKIVKGDNGKVIAGIDSREERIIQGIVETPTNRPIVDPKAFKNWVKFSLRAKIPWFFLETLAPYYCRFYYLWNRFKHRHIHP